MFRLDSKIILIITGLSHFVVHSSMIILPVIFVKLTNEFGVGLDTLGLIAMISNFMFGLGAIPTGWLESRLGGRKLLLIYQIGIVISGIVIFVSTNLFQLTIGLILLGLFASIYHPAGLTLISRRIKQTSRAMGIHGIAGSIGLAFGPLMASWFTVHISWRMAYGTMALISFVLAVATAIFIPARQNTGQDDDVIQTSSNKIRHLIVYFFIAILSGLAYNGFTTYMPTHFSQNSDAILLNMDNVIKGGLFTTLVLFAGIIGQMIGGKLGDTYSRTSVLPWIVFGNIPLLFALGFTNNFSLLTFSILLGVVHFSFQPIGNSIIAQYTNSQSRGIGYGILAFLTFGIGSIAAGVGGYIAENYSVSSVFPVMAGIMGVALVFSIYLKRIS